MKKRINGVVQEWAAFSSADVSLPVARSTLAVRLCCRLRLKCDGTRAETSLRLSAKRTSPFKSAGASVQSTTSSRDVRISGSNAGYTMLRGSVKRAGYPLHSPFSPSLPLPCATVCHHISLDCTCRIIVSGRSLPGLYHSLFLHVLQQDMLVVLPFSLLFRSTPRGEG